jgi:iron(III) transport system ATP-binding protein
MSAKPLTTATDKMRTPAGVSFASRLAFDAITHHFGDDRLVIDGVSLVVEPGEVMCLLGPSGSGKSTLLRIAAGIEPQIAGSVLLNNTVIAGGTVFVPPEKRSIGLVFQDFALFPHMTILDNVRYGLTALSKADSHAEAKRALERVGLDHYADAYPHILSGGEQQRVALARALAPRPGVLLMDEPFSGLDSRLKDTIRADTLAILRQTRATAIMVTHDAEEAMRMGDRIALMRDGKIVQVGTGEALYRRPASLFAARFFSELNVFEARVSNGRALTPIGAFFAGFADGTAVDVAVRPGLLRLGPPGDGVAARVTSRRFVGDDELFELAVDGADQRIRARIRCGTVSPDLRDVGISTETEDALVFETEPDKA